MAIRRRHSTSTEKTVANKNLMITDAAEGKMKSLTIKGVNRQVYDSNAISRNYPRDILSSDTFNLMFNGMKNEITDEYIERLLNEEWTRHINTETGEQTNYYKSPTLQLKPNTTYTFYRASEEYRNDASSLLLTQPYSSSCYGGLGYNTQSIPVSNSQYGLTTWVWHKTHDGLNCKYFTFTTDDTGRVWFTTTNGYNLTGIERWLNSIDVNGLIIVEGNYTQVQMEQNIINIPKNLILDDGSEVNLQLWNVFDTSDKNSIYDSINVDYENNKVTYIKKIYECVCDGAKSKHANYGYETVTRSSKRTMIICYQNYIYGGDKCPSSYPNDYHTAGAHIFMYKPISNQFSGLAAYDSDNANYITSGAPTDYSGFTKFYVDNSYIDAYTGVYTCHLEDINISAETDCYFTVNEINYKFTAPIDMGEFTSIKFNPTSATLLINEDDTEYTIAETIPEVAQILTFISLDSDVNGKLKNRQYWKDLNAVDTPVIFRYPSLEESWQTTDITNSDLGRQLLALRLKQNNTISTDNWYCNEIEITYKAR